MADAGTIRRRFFRDLAAFEGRGVLTGGQRTTTVAGSTSSLIEARWPIQTPRVPRTYAYDGWHLLRPTASAADKVRLVMLGGLNSQSGQFTPDADWGVAPANGEAYELLGPGISPLDELTELVNAALKSIWLKVDVQFTPPTDDTRGRYVPTLDADGNPLAAWLVNESQILSVRQQASLEEYSAVNMGVVGPLRGHGVRSGSRLYLTLSDAFFPSTAVYATVKKPAYCHCRASASAAFGSQSGLTAGVDANEALPDEDWIVAGALVAAWQHASTTMEQAVERRRDKYLQEAAIRFQQRQDDYWQANPVDTTWVPYGSQRAWTTIR